MSDLSGVLARTPTPTPTVATTYSYEAVKLGNAAAQTTMMNVKTVSCAVCKKSLCCREGCY
jgi:hypothetical protein